MAKKKPARKLIAKKVPGKVGVPANLLKQGIPQPLGAAPKPFSPLPTPPAPPSLGPKPTPDARDSQYTSAIASNLFRRNQGLANLTQADSYARTDADTAVGRLALQQTQANQNATEGSNKQGLFYSGILGKRLGDIETGYKGQRDDVATRLARTLAGNEAQRQTLIGQYGDPNKEGDYGLEGGELFAGAQGRLAQYLMANPIDPIPEGTPTPMGEQMARVAATREQTRLAAPFVNRKVPKFKPKKGKRPRMGAQMSSTEGVWR